MTVKVYSPEEIESIKHTITPVERVRNGLSQQRSSIIADRCPSPISAKRRGESVDKFRG